MQSNLRKTNARAVCGRQLVAAGFAHSRRSRQDREIAVTASALLWAVQGKPFWNLQTEKGTDSISYAYDPDGICTSKTVNGNVAKFRIMNSTLLGQTKGSDTIVFLYDKKANKYGFDYNGAKYYDSSTKRFVSCDVEPAVTVSLEHF